MSPNVGALVYSMYADNQLSKPRVDSIEPIEGTALVGYEESSEDVFGDLRWEMDMNVLRTHYTKGHFEK